MTPDELATLLARYLRKPEKEMRNLIMRYSVKLLTGKLSDADMRSFLRESERIERKFTRSFVEVATPVIRQAYLDGSNEVMEIMRLGRDGTVDAKTVSVLIQDCISDFTRGLRQGRETVGSFFVLSKQGILTETEMTEAFIAGLTSEDLRRRTMQEGLRILADKLRARLNTSPIATVPAEEQRQLINALVQRAIDNGMPKQFVDHYRKTVENEGFIRIINKNGDYMTFRVNHYAEMVATTRMSRAQTEGTIQTGLKNGAAFLRITSHNSPNFCGQMEGRLIAIDPQYVGWRYNNLKTRAPENVLWYKDKIVIRHVRPRKTMPAAIDVHNVTTVPGYHINCKHRSLIYIPTSAWWRKFYEMNGRAVPEWAA